MLGPKEDNVMLEDKDRLLPSRILEAGWKKKYTKELDTKKVQQLVINY